MQLELMDAKGSTGVFIELPLGEIFRQVQDLGNASVADPSATEPEIPTDAKEFFVPVAEEG